MKTEMKKLDRALEAWRFAQYRRWVRTKAVRPDMAYARVCDLQRRHELALKLHAQLVCDRSVMQ